MPVLVSDAYKLQDQCLSLFLRSMPVLVSASVIGARYLHPKEDGNIKTGQTDYYPAGIKIDAYGKNKAIDPDGEWGNTEGMEGGEVAWIFLNSGDENRQQIVGRHEAGHASDHEPFGGRTDHADEGLMTELGASAIFSDDSILRLRGWSR